MQSRSILSTVLLLLALFSLSATSAFGQGQDVLVWGTGTDQAAVDEIATYIDANGSFNSVTGLSTITQTLAQLTPYDSVLFFTNGSTGSDPLNGDVLADYADTGARLVLCTFSWANQSGNTLAGRIVTDELSPFVIDGSSLYSNVSMTSNDGSSYFDGVASINGHFHDNVDLNPGAVQNATWSDGEPMVATKGNVVAVNLFPEVNQISGDYEELFANVVTSSWSGCNDADGDGYGVGNTTNCTNAAEDCDDNEVLTYPGAVELCDGFDNNCDGALPTDETDSDNDSWAACEGDCAPNDATVYPMADELCDGLDNDCDGVLPDDEVDADDDGYRLCDEDCDDNAAAANPGATEDSDEACSDALDNDCDGLTDVADDDCEGSMGDDDDSAGDDDDDSRRSRSICGCSASASESPGGVFGLLLLLALGLSRRVGPHRL
jgi:MYXO-CTERM domain-containing protein